MQYKQTEEVPPDITLMEILASGFLVFALIGVGVYMATLVN